MAFAKIKTGFTRYTDGNLLTKGRYIVSKMKSNIIIVNTTPSVADVETAVDNFGDSITAAQDGGKQATTNKKAMRAALILILNNLGLLIQLASAGDEATILSTGYDVAKTHARVGLLSKPQSFSAAEGPNSGSVTLKTNTVPHAAVYEFEYRLVDGEATEPADWLMQTSSKRKCIISGLTVGAQYNFRVAGSGSDPGRVYSDVISKYVS